MIIKSRIIHNVSLKKFLQHQLKCSYYAIPSFAFEPEINEIPICFVVGCGHSGTTLLAAKLGNHPEILAIGRETGALLPGNNSLFGAKKILDEWAYFAEKEGKRVILEKTPKHVFSYNRVQKLAPNNKYIAITRNPLDTIASLYKRFHDLELSTERWIFDNTELINIRDKANVTVIQYEQLTRNPEETFKSILSFIDLDYHESVLEKKSSIYSKTSQEGNMKLRQHQVEQPIKPNEGGWRKILNDRQYEYVQKRVKNIASQLSYDI